MRVFGKPLTVHCWNGHRIEVRFRASPRYLWMAAGFFVRVDDTDVFGPPERLERGKTTTAFKIEDNRRLVEGKVGLAGKKAVLHAAYEVTLDGTVIAKGVLRSENWYVTLGILAGALLFVAASCLL